ncbi:peptidyl-prolyl cis-trans isomerase SurA [Rubricella aquisinus]|uniref:Parvulin-like PPIase n=1 Tax=Rubricella aquisinus TaxID=2028108 RepID=A0A840WMP8_9RHOB|nr:peptidylprolyl isomerase [Rubricella aquisinus]MBB5514932.1 peptidyl-prolyl cis-trans isomerase SurA [Rubricella aquisinus]
MLSIRLFLTVMILGLFPLPALAQDSFTPAVIVNDRVISNYDVAQRAGILELLGERQNSLETAQDQLIEEALMLWEADRQGIAANEQLIEEGLASFAAQRGASPEELIGAIRNANLDPRSLLRLVEAQLLWQESMRRRFSGRARPSDGEVDDAIILAATEPAREVRLAELAFPIFERGEEESVALIRRLYTELSQGGDFAAAAREYSRTPTAAQGGDLGWQRPENLPPRMQQQISILDVGEVSQPIPITRGVSLLKLIGDREVPSRDAARVSLRYAIASFTGDGATDRARAARAAATSCDAVAAGLPGAQDQTIVGPTTLDQVQGDLFNVLSQLTPGIASQPIPVQQGGSRLVLLCERDVDVTAEERNAIGDRLFSERVTGYAEGYMQQLRRDALIERR